MSESVFQRRFARYGLAVAAIGVSALLRWLMPEVLGRAPYLGFYSAVVVAAALGGVGPGLVATFGSLLFVNLVFAQFNLADFGLQMRNLIWILGSTGVSFLAGWLRDARRQAEAESTAARAAETALRQQAELIDQAGEALIVRELGGVIRSWNRGAEQVYGWSAATAVGQSIHALLRTTPAALVETIEAALAQTGRWDGELVHTTRDGRPITVLAHKTATRTSDGRMLVLESLRDITARKRAEAALTQHREQLEQLVETRTAELARSNRELEHFAYVASHDLQEPLRTMSSFSQLLADNYRGKLDRDADDFIAFIVEGAKRMQTLINDLLAYSRVGTRGAPFTPVDGASVVRLAREQLELAITECGAVITHDPLPTVQADAGQLTQLFQNLFSNAIKFRRPGEAPRIHVSAKRLTEVDTDEPPRAAEPPPLAPRPSPPATSGPGWQFSVRDNGIGIDPQYFDRIFVMFQRLHDREQYSGTGIGLAICKKIVERHGGRLWVESEPGNGSTFHFTLPEAANPYGKP